MGIYFRTFVHTFALIFVLNTETLIAQGYISPFKYDNGNFVLKSKFEIRNEESKRYSSYYKPTDNKKNKSSAKNREIQEFISMADERAYYEKLLNDRKRRDSTHEALRLAGDKLVATDYYKLYKRIQDLMSQMNYQAVDSLTELYNTNLPSETNGRGEWDYYRARLGNRLISQMCLGSIDRAWRTFKNIELADQTALANRFYLEHTKPQDLQLIKAYILYEGGAYDTALQVCNKFIKSLPSKDSFSVLYPEIYCLQSRCYLALGNVKEAKRSLDEYMTKSNNEYKSLLMKYNGSLKSFIGETYGMIFQKQGNPDSAFYYFRAAAMGGMGGLDGFARNYQVPYISFIGAKFDPPIREAFLQAALLGGYKLNDPADEGYKFLIIADKLGMAKAGYLLDKNIPWKTPIKEVKKK